jgi:pyridoxal phosphate enzyme (YggS family)
MTIAENVAAIQERIATAAGRVQRSPENIILMGVTKTVAPEQIRDAYAAGVRIFGENRVQEFAGKYEALRHLPGTEWHMIGHLQTNKAAKAAELFAAIDSVDSIRLAEKLNSAAAALGKALRILIEINIGGEQAKSGLAPDSAELEDLLQRSAEFASLRFCGLMTVPPHDDDPEASRPYFRRMLELFEALAARKIPAIEMDILSMGMSHDFEVAIEEGANCIRLGTALFGERPAARSTD